MTNVKVRNRKWCAALAGAVCLAMFSGTVSFAGESSDTAGKLLAVMTKEEKVGQMLMVSPSQLCDGDWSGNIQQVLQNIDFYHIGNLIFFEEDLRDEEAVRELIGALSEKEGLVGVLTAADVSGSLEDGFTKPQEDTVLAVGPFEEGAESLWGYGIAGAAGEQLQELGIIMDAAPGIGADREPDVQFAVVTHAKVDSGSDMDAGRPASMAKSMVKDRLKQVFEGVVMTDALTTAEAAEPYGADMAVQYAFQAGNDILVAPANLMNAYYGMLSAMDEQLVSEEQVNESVLRVLDAKLGLGLIK